MRSSVLYTLLAGLLIATLCAAAPADKSGHDSLQVSVPVPPYGWLLSELIGSDDAAQVVIPSGQSPHTFDPTPRDVVRLGSSDLYFWIGMPFEERLRPMLTKQFPNLEIIDLRRGITLQAMFAHHHHDGTVHAESIDPHIWMSPQRMRAQAHLAYDALVAMRPSDSAKFTANLQHVLTELDSLDSLFHEHLGDTPYRTFFIHHPSLGYIAADYGLTQRAIEFEGKSPTARALAEQLQVLTSDSTHTLFVDRQNVGSQVRDLMQSLGITVVEIDPLEGDYPTNMRRVAQALKRALTPAESE